MVIDNTYLNPDFVILPCPLRLQELFLKLLTGKHMIFIRIRNSLIFTLHNRWKSETRGLYTNF